MARHIPRGDHRHFGEIPRIKRNWMTKMGAVWQRHRMSIIMFFVICATAFMAMQQIKNDHENTAGAVKQGNVLTIPEITIK